MDNEKDSLLTLAEGARLLKCSRSLLYRLIEQGYPLPVIRVGILIRFRASELIEFFQTGKLEQARKEKIDAKVNQLTDKIKG